MRDVHMPLRIIHWDMVTCHISWQLIFSSHIILGEGERGKRLGDRMFTLHWGCAHAIYV